MLRTHKAPWLKAFSRQSITAALTGLTTAVPWSLLNHTPAWRWRGFDHAALETRHSLLWFMSVWIMNKNSSSSIGNKPTLYSAVCISLLLKHCMPGLLTFLVFFPERSPLHCKPSSLLVRFIASALQGSSSSGLYKIWAVSVIPAWESVLSDLGWGRRPKTITPFVNANYPFLANYWFLWNVFANYINHKELVDVFYCLERERKGQLNLFLEGRPERDKSASLDRSSHHECYYKSKAAYSLSIIEQIGSVHTDLDSSCHNLDRNLSILYNFRNPIETSCNVCLKWSNEIFWLVLKVDLKPPHCNIQLNDKSNIPLVSEDPRRFIFVQQWELTTEQTRSFWESTRKSPRDH